MKKSEVYFWTTLIKSKIHSEGKLNTSVDLWINSVWICVFVSGTSVFRSSLQPPVWKKGTDAQLRLWLSMHVTQLLAEAFHQYFFKMWHVYIVLLTNSSEFRKIPLGILIRTFKDSPYKLCSIMRRSQRNLKEHQKDQNQNICTVLSVFSYG